MSSSAVASGPDVILNWEVNQAESITAFIVHRGMTPDNLEPVATLGGDDRTYVDKHAILSGQAIWYVVEVHYADGTVLRGAPTHPSGVQASFET